MISVRITLVRTFYDSWGHLNLKSSFCSSNIQGEFLNINYCCFSYLNSTLKLQSDFVTTIAPFCPNVNPYWDCPRINNCKHKLILFANKAAWLQLYKPVFIYKSFVFYICCSIRNISPIIITNCKKMYCDNWFIILVSLTKIKIIDISHGIFFLIFQNSNDFQ